MPGVYTVEKDGVQKPILINRLGNGLRFEGDNDYIQSPHNEALNFNLDDPYSAAFICYVEDKVSSYFPIISKRSAAYGWNISLERVSGGFRVHAARANGTMYSFAFSPVLKVNTFYHIVVTSADRNCFNVKFYVDGKLVPTTTSLNTLSVGILNTNPIQIGRWLNSSGTVFYFKGYLFSMMVFNKVLSEEEAFILGRTWNNRLFPQASLSLVANYDFQQTQGGLLPDLAIENNGVLVNFANTSLGLTNQWVDKYQQPITS